MILCKKFRFDAAHRLPHYSGKCYNIHDHTFFLDVEIEGTVNSDGFVIDFICLKSIVEAEVISIFDHSYLNDIIENPTCENVIKWIWNKLSPNLLVESHSDGYSDGWRRLYKLRLWETPDSYAEYSGEMAESEAQGINSRK